MQAATRLPGVWHSAQALGGQRFLFVTVGTFHLNTHSQKHGVPAFQAHSTHQRLAERRVTRKGWSRRWHGTPGVPRSTEPGLLEKVLTNLFGKVSWGVSQESRAGHSWWRQRTAHGHARRDAWSAVSLGGAWRCSGEGWGGDKGTGANSGGLGHPVKQSKVHAENAWRVFSLSPIC